MTHDKYEVTVIIGNTDLFSVNIYEDEFAHENFRRALEAGNVSIRIETLKEVRTEVGTEKVRWWKK